MEKVTSWVKPAFKKKYICLDHCGRVTKMTCKSENFTSKIIKETQLDPCGYCRKRQLDEDLKASFSTVQNKMAKETRLPSSRSNKICCLF